MIRRKTSHSETQRDSVLKFQKVICSSICPQLPLFPALMLCLSHCTVGETGLLVSKIGASTPFVGYVNNQQQTERKKLKDVFVKGDLYLNSGDLLRIDSEGFVYFQDRTGDTYRFSDWFNLVLYTKRKDDL